MLFWLKAGLCLWRKLALPYGHVLTAMDVSDDIEVGDSYFITESKAILRMIQHLNDPGFTISLLTSSLRGPIPSSGSDQALNCPLVGCPKLSLHDFQP